MAATRKTAGARAAGKAPARSPKPKLPPVTVARFETALSLIEKVFDENVDLFVAKGQEYRQRHRGGTSRSLTAQEAAQVAAGMAAGAGLPPVTLAVAVQESDLRAHDEPSPREVLTAAGIATAPAYMGVAKRLVALIEMPADVFEQAYDTDTVDDALDEVVKAMAHEDLAGEQGARERAAAAFEHFAEAAGGSGKALRELIPMLWQVVKAGADQLGLTKDQPPSSLTGSPPNTDGLSETSSTASGTSAR